MTASVIISHVGKLLVVLIIYSYILGTRCYSKGFQDGLKMGERISEIDSKTDKEQEE